jgi:hypothetical protein
LTILSVFFKCWMKHHWHFSFDVHYNMWHLNVLKDQSFVVTHELSMTWGLYCNFRNRKWVVTRMFKLNFYLQPEWKPKLEDYNQKPICGGRCVRVMNRRAKNLWLMQNLNVKCNYKIETTHMNPLLKGVEPNLVLGSPQLE